MRKVSIVSPAATISFSHAKAAAAALNTPFNWALATVPNVEHSNQGMAPSALQHLLPLSSL